MSGSTRFASWDANTDGRSSGKTCLLHCTGRTADTLDCTDDFHQAPMLDDVVVEPPEEYLSRLRAAGKCTNIWWKLQKQLPGRRRAGQR